MLYKDTRGGAIFTAFVNNQERPIANRGWCRARTAQVAGALAMGALLCLGSLAGASADPNSPVAPSTVSAPSIDGGNGLWSNPSTPLSGAPASLDAVWRTPPTPPSVGDSGPVGAGAQGDSALRSSLFSRGDSPASSSARATAGVAESAKGAKLGTTVTASASCPAGHVLRSGGASVQTSNGDNAGRAVLSQSYASSTTTWTAVGVVAGANLSADESLDLVTVALCD